MNDYQECFETCRVIPDFSITAILFELSTGSSRHEPVIRVIQMNLRKRP